MTERTTPVPATDATARAALVEKLTAIKRNVGAVAKAERNTQQNFNFRGIDAVVNALSPELMKAGVVVTPVASFAKSEHITYGSKGTPGIRVEVTVTYMATDGAGEVFASVCAEAIDSGDKATAKAMSVAYRIALLQLFSLPTDEPDPDLSSYDVNEDPTRAREAVGAAFQASGLALPMLREIVVGAIGRAIKSTDDLSVSECEKVLTALQAKLDQPEEPF